MPVGKRWATVALIVLACSAMAILPGMAPAIAQSGPEFVYSGGGWGHGLGMGQWGAKGQADAGRTFEQILSHYYTGASVARSESKPLLRVGILWDVGMIDVAGSGKFELRYGTPDGELLESGQANETWRVSTDQTGSLHLTSPGKPEIVRPGSGALYVVYAAHGTTLRLPQTGNRYVYGVLEISSYSTSGLPLVRAVMTDLDVQNYLYGLGEMPASWPMDALKAQAVAARTYAVEKIARMGQERLPCKCGMYSSTLDQAYVGFEKEGGPSGDRWKAAVDATNGQVLKVNDKMIEAYYHSSSGGHTENNEYVWGGTPRTYLRGVPDPWDSGPRHSWTVRITREDLQTRLSARNETNAGDLRSVEIVGPLGVSGRVLSWGPSQGGVKIQGAAGEKRVSGSRFKTALGLLSTLFYDGEQRPSPGPAPADEPAPPAAQTTPEVAASTQSAPGQVHPSGTLIKASDPTIYYLEGNKKRPIANQAILDSRFTKGEVVNITDAELATYPNGLRLGYRNGSLINVPGRPVWVISDGHKRGIVSGEVFDNLGYRWSNVKRVTPGEITLYEEGPPITLMGKHPNGTVVQGSGPSVYLIDRGRKRHIMSMSIFVSRFRVEDIVKVPDSELASYADGERLGFREGSLLRSSDGARFVVSEGKRRPISPERFAALGYSEANLRAATPEELAVHAEGAPL